MLTRRPLVALLIIGALVGGLAHGVGVRSVGGQEALTEVRLVARPDPQAPFAFEPNLITITPGTTVRWVNTGDVFHTVTFADSVERRESNGTFDQSLFGSGVSVERRFTSPGTYAFFCQPHSAFMFGTIIVSEASAEPPTPLIAGLAAAALAALLAGWWRRRRRLASATPKQI